MAYRNKSTRGFEQFRKIIEVRGTGVANHEVAKPALTPRFHVEREFLPSESVSVQPGCQGPLLEYEHGDMVLPHVINEVCAWRLIEIGHPAAYQGELGVLEFRQIERKGNFSLEPGLYRVPVGRDHIHWRRTGQRRHMQVCNLAVNLISAGAGFHIG